MFITLLPILKGNLTFNGSMHAPNVSWLLLNLMENVQLYDCYTCRNIVNVLRMSLKYLQYMACTLLL